VNAGEWGVLAGGAAAIAWINWWFFFAAKRSASAKDSGAGVQTARVVVRGGYEPGEVRLRAGVRTRLEFERQENAGCSEEIVIPELGVRQFLAPFETTVVELPPLEPGTYEMTCGMSMLRGRLVVERS
jgi:plastocyanin domain-containing protein